MSVINVALIVFGCLVGGYYMETTKHYCVYEEKKFSTGSIYNSKICKYEKQYNEIINKHETVAVWADLPSKGAKIIGPLSSFPEDKESPPPSPLASTPHKTIIPLPPGIGLK